MDSVRGSIGSWWQLPVQDRLSGAGSRCYPTLEFRLVCEGENPWRPSISARPLGCERYKSREWHPRLLKRRTIVTATRVLRANLDYTSIPADPCASMPRVAGSGDHKAIEQGPGVVSSSRNATKWRRDGR